VVTSSLVVNTHNSERRHGSVSIHAMVLIPPVGDSPIFTLSTNEISQSHILHGERRTNPFNQV
jgi:hypothetical protein